MPPPQDRPDALSSSPFEPLHPASPDQAADILQSDLHSGLSAPEAARRAALWGPNALPSQEGFSALHTAVRQLLDPLILVLLAAAALAGALGERLDAIMILVIVALNAALSFFQEWRAERALISLSQMLTAKATVVRSGRVMKIDARDIVPGDLVRLERGERIPADVKLIDATALIVDESALTGEAHGVTKTPGADPADAALHERQSIVYAGSLVLDGRGAGLVIATGSGSEFGNVAALAASVQRQATPLQKRLSRLARRLGALALLAAVAVAVIGYAAGRPLLDVVFTSVSLAVAAVPEGLPALVALSLALGVRTMAQRNALVRRLRAAESLGSATVICTDKTGTLTTGRMVAVRAATAAGEHALDEVASEKDPLLIDLLRTAGWCNDAEPAPGGARGEPTETALLDAALSWAAMDEDAPARVAEEPFSAERKRMTVVVEREGCWEAHMKGAPEVVLGLCTHSAEPEGDQAMSAADREAWLAQIETMSGEGLRVIATARKLGDASLSQSPDSDSGGFVFLGLIGLMDPPRPRARPAVAAARNAGVRVLMITGDGPGTALAIAEKVGLEHDIVLTGADIDQLDDDALLEQLKRGPVLSRTTPEHKLRVVRLLQSGGEIVAMTGDGVNDAPALKQSDIGIAMGIRGVDAAKAAADIVLLDDDFGTIVDAIREGRRQDESIRNFTRFLLSHNFGEVAAVAVSVASGAPLILTPAHLLWINLATDGPIALALGVERANADLMKRPPREPGSRILDRTAALLALTYGGWLSGATLLVFFLTLPQGLELARTAAFTCVVMLSLAGVISFRSLTTPLHRLGWFSNRWLLGAMAGTFALQLALVYVPPLQHAMELAPLPLWIWGVIAVLAAPVVIIPEAIKLIRSRVKSAARPR